ncbi:MAG: toxin HicA [Bacteroidia bacterium]|nr:toxin HicA [Bacteroidia bacterium]
MGSLEHILAAMRRNPCGVRFPELKHVCDHYFGAPRAADGSHRVYRTPWKGDPRINIQNDKGFAKAYQVRQVLKAITRLEKGDSDEK